jgi:hypothetical protein
MKKMKRSLLGCIWLPILVLSVKGQTSQDDIFGDFDENANFDDFTPDMSKPSDDFLAQMMALAAQKLGGALPQTPVLPSKNNKKKKKEKEISKKVRK